MVDGYWQHGWCVTCKGKMSGRPISALLGDGGREGLLAMADGINLTVFRHEE